MTMSTIITFADVQQYRVDHCKHRRSLLRWMRLVMRAHLNAIRRRQRRRLAIHSLEALDDRVLRDIGIDRGSIRVMPRQVLSRLGDRHRTDAPQAPAAVTSETAPQLGRV
jgi:uncharacterized protein YjiS (DUF1127 family)